MNDDVTDPALALFRAIYRLTPAVRAARLDAETAGQPELRAAVEELLQHYDGPAPIVRDAEEAVDMAAVDMAAVDTSTAALPEHIGPYKIESVLGRGGMGIVYRAEQPTPRRPVALKVIASPFLAAEHAQRLVREAEILGQLQHPGIAQVFAAGSFTEGGRELPYFAMELVDGVALHEWSRGLPIAARLEVFAGICDAVQHAHEQGVVHRDLKPANILVEDVEGTPRARVLDFGIARSMDVDTQWQTLQTNTGQLIGTLAYMSPEQACGSRVLDPRSDVYSLGVILYELLCGQLPFELEGVPLHEATRIVAEDTALLLGRVDRGLRGDLETIVDKAMRKESHYRYQSAAELAADLRRYLRDEPVAARRATTIYQLRKFTRRHRALVFGVLSTMVALTGGLIGTAMFAAEASELAESESKLKDEAVAKSDELERSLYRSEMRLAGAVLRADGGRGRAKLIAGRWAPAEGAPRPEFVGWEWDLLRRHAHPETVILRRTQYVLHWDPAGLYVLGGRGPALEQTPLLLRPDSLQETGLTLPRYERSAMSPGGKRIAIFTKWSMKVFAYPSGDELAVLLRDRSVMMADWSPDGELVAVQIPRGEVHVVRVADSATVATLKGIGTAHCFARFSLDGRWLAVWTNLGRKVTLYSTATWTAVRDLTEHSAGVVQVRFHPKDATVAISARDGTVRIFDTDTGTQRRLLHEHRRDVHGMAWHRDGRLLATSSADNTVRLHDLATGRSRLLGSHRLQPWTLVWGPDGKRLATASHGREGDLRIWDITRPPAIRTLVHAAPKQRGIHVRWHPTEPRLVVGIGGESRVLDARTGAVLQTLPGTRGCWSHDGAWLACREGDDVVVRADGHSEVLHRTTVAALNSGLSFCPDERTLVAGSGRAVTIWRPGAGAPRVMETGNLMHFFWRPGAKEATVVTWNDFVIAIDLPGGPRRRLARFRRALSGAWDAAGARLALGFMDQSVRIYVPTGVPHPESNDNGSLALRETHELTGHTDQVLAVAWHPDGKRLATGGRDRTVRIWDPEDGCDVIAVRHGDADVVSLAWSPDGKMLASLSRNGELQVWDTTQR